MNAKMVAKFECGNFANLTTLHKTLTDIVPLGYFLVSLLYLHDYNEHYPHPNKMICVKSYVQKNEHQAHTLKKTSFSDHRF